MHHDRFAMADPDPSCLAAQLSALPPGRMLAVRQVEAGLREGRTYAEAARRAKVSEVTAKRWAAAFAIRKSDLEAERAEARCDELRRAAEAECASLREQLEVTQQLELGP